MLWFLLPLGAAFLWSISNHIDKFIISKYFQAGGIGSIVIFTCLFNVLSLPLIAIFNPGVFSVSTWHILILMFLGIVGMIQLIIYFQALSLDEASVVVPLFQIIPVLTYIISYFVLGETLTGKQLVAGLLILFGSTTLALDITGRIPKVKFAVLGLMTLSSLLISLNSVVFKAIALQESFWTASFWSFTGTGVIGLILFLLVRSYQQQVIRVVTSTKAKILWINGLNEVINFIALISATYATLIAPVALVQIVGGIQPLFVLLIGVFLTLFFPRYGKESILTRHLIQKIGAIAVIFLGTYLLNS